MIVVKSPLAIFYIACLTLKNLEFKKVCILTYSQKDRLDRIQHILLPNTEKNYLSKTVFRSSRGDKKVARNTY